MISTSKKWLQSHQEYFKILLVCGAIAQLVERMDGIHEVTGSNPVSSTIRRCVFRAMA